MVRSVPNRPVDVLNNTTLHCTVDTALHLLKYTALHCTALHALCEGEEPAFAVRWPLGDRSLVKNLDWIFFSYLFLSHF